MEPNEEVWRANLTKGADKAEKNIRAKIKRGDLGKDVGEALIAQMRSKIGGVTPVALEEKQRLAEQSRGKVLESLRDTVTRMDQAGWLEVIGRPSKITPEVKDSRHCVIHAGEHHPLFMVVLRGCASQLGFPPDMRDIRRLDAETNLTALLRGLGFDVVECSCGAGPTK